MLTKLTDSSSFQIRSIVPQNALVAVEEQLTFTGRS